MPTTWNRSPEEFHKIYIANTDAFYRIGSMALAKELDTEINTEPVPGKAVSLVAETKDGKNSFRVRIAPPEGKSFARNIAEKYGVTYEHLTGGDQPGGKTTEKP